MTAPVSSLLLDLNRPQYVSVPEALLSALSWRAYDADFAIADRKRTAAVLYELKGGERKPTKTLEYIVTRPRGEDIKALTQQLDALGVTSGIGIGDAVAHSILGLRSSKGTFQPASPLTVKLGLLQNLSGLQGSANPPNLGEIIETMYAMGHEADGATATGRWLHADEVRLRHDPLLRAIDRAITAVALPPLRRKGLASTATEADPNNEIAFASTPFSWLARTWDVLTREEWVMALPARVWVDWATTVLRLAIGCGYLWEAAWYDTIGRAIVGDTSATRMDLKEAMPLSLPWHPSSTETAARDVAPLLSWRIRRAYQIRGHLKQWVSDHASELLDVPRALVMMSEDGKFRERIKEDLRSRQRPAAAENTWEAVKYALKTREESGDQADFYGLLRARGRYLFVDPGTEWIAVVASLECGLPGESTDLGSVMSSLYELGIRPQMTDVISLLEDAGLARGSADADQGLVVQSAY